MEMNMTIIIYAGIFSLLFFPSMTYLILRARKGKMGKVNDGIDKMFPRQEETKASSVDARSEWEKNQESLTCIRLTVGDTYQCMLTETEKYEVGTKRTWSSTEPFVGEIDGDSAMFTALKVGSTYIECGEVLLYYIEVVPMIKSWLFDTFYASVCGTRRIQQENKQSNMKKLKKRLGVRFKDLRLTCKESKATHAVLFLKNKLSCVSIIKQGMAERMEMIETSLLDTTVWVHKNGKGSDEIVDYAAFLKVNDESNVIFGIGQNWRQGGNIKEFTANAAMFIHTFMEHLSEDDLPAVCVQQKEEAVEDPVILPVEPVEPIPPVHDDGADSVIETAFEAIPCEPADDAVEDDATKDEDLVIIDDLESEEAASWDDSVVSDEYLADAILEESVLLEEDEED